jgi:hypothetical protein
MHRPTVYHNFSHPSTYKQQDPNVLLAARSLLGVNGGLFAHGGEDNNICNL